MRKFAFLICLFVSSQVFAGQQSAGWKFMPALMYFNNSTQSGTTVSAVNRIFGDAGLGLTFQGSPLFLGALASYDATTNSGSNTNKDVALSYGGSLGILTDTVYMIVTYYASSQLDQTTVLGITSLTGGSGFQFSIGYLFSLTQTISLAPQFSYRSLSYSQSRSPAGVTSSVSATYNNLIPFFSFVVSL